MALEPRTVEQLIARGPPYACVFFWGHTPKSAGDVDRSCLSQWFAAPFVVDGVRYATAEHWMMAGKARTFGDDGALAAVLASDDPARAKEAGRGVRGFDKERWGAVCVELVTRGNVEKFGQHAALWRFLDGTADQILVEAAPNDPIWGIGLGANDVRALDPGTWRGANLLGFALMEARARLRAAAAQESGPSRGL